VEKLSKNQTPPVQIAAENQQEPSTSKSSPEISTPKPPVLPFNLSAVSPDAIKTAEAVTGLPLSKLPAYFDDLQAFNEAMQKRMEVVLNVLAHFDEGVKTSVAKMVKESQTQQQQAAPPQAQASPTPMQNNAGGNPLAMLNNPLVTGILQSFMGGATASEPFGEMAKKWFMEAAMESLSFTKTFNQTVLSKIGGKMVNDVIDTTAVKTQ
jgi:hypothetical protein